MTISSYIASSMSKASWIRKMFETGNELRKKYGNENVFDFTLGNPTAPPPEKFNQVLKETALSTEKGVHRYMSNSGLESTRKSVADALNVDTEKHISPENVIMTVGAAGALNITLKSLIDPGDEVIFMVPYFPEYHFYVENHCGKAVTVETDEHFQVVPDAIRAALTNKTRALILNTPNNPTGVIYKRSTLEKINSILLEHKRNTGHTVYVISDEPYRKLIYEGVKIPSTIDIFNDIIFCTSHSKDLGLPGERIGFAVVAPGCDDEKELINALIFCNRTLGYVNAPAFMQRIVGKLQTETVNINEYEEKRNIFYEGLMEAGYELVKPEGAFYLFPKSPVDDDVKFVQALVEEKILAVPGSGFGRKGFFRLSYCLDFSTIQRSIPIFKRVLDHF
ncbi:MAG: pyridoxal phosphate-dependent aminotransferase [Deltaproteobacteria bacterium]|nr:pyridoxal phosphate-dependent aminotransferase [Deltaproteobacteria bacterium]